MMSFKKLADFLWPIAATVLALLVMPLAIEQYPDFFKENRWPLPVSVVVVLICWVLPFLRDDRAKVIFEWASRHGWIAKGATGIALIVLTATIAWAGWKLFRFHSTHLEAALRKKDSKGFGAASRPNEMPSTPAPDSPSTEVKKGPPFTAEQMEQFKGAIREAVNNSRAPTPIRKPKDDGRPFLFTIDVAMFSPSRDRTLTLYFASPGAEGMCIYPVNLALYLRLQNLQRTTSRLAGWNLELAYGEEWVKAVSLDSRFGTIYFVSQNDPQHAGRVNSTAGFDMQLASKSYTLNRSESVERWALFEYPKAHPFFAGGYKLKVNDTLGHNWSGEVSWPNAPNKDINLLGGSFKFTGMGDVSKFHMKFADD